jgi:hypothetical protein
MSTTSDDVFRLRNEGLTFKDISLKLGGLSRQRYQQIYKKHCRENNIIIIKKGNEKSYHCFDGIQIGCNCCFQGIFGNTIIGWGGTH